MGGLEAVLLAGAHPAGFENSACPGRRRREAHRRPPPRKPTPRPRTARIPRPEASRRDGSRTASEPTPPCSRGLPVPPCGPGVQPALDSEHLVTVQSPLLGPRGRLEAFRASSHNRATAKPSSGRTRHSRSASTSIPFRETRLDPCRELDGQRVRGGHVKEVREVVAKPIRSALMRYSPGADACSWKRPPLRVSPCLISRPLRSTKLTITPPIQFPPAASTSLPRTTWPLAEPGTAANIHRTAKNENSVGAGRKQFPPRRLICVPLQQNCGVTLHGHAPRGDPPTESPAAPAA